MKAPAKFRKWLLLEVYLATKRELPMWCLALRIVSHHFLPEGSAYDVTAQMEAVSGDVLKASFGDLGVQDKAKFLATLFINDLSAVITQGVDPYFEVSRYGERLAAANPYFDDLYATLADLQCSFCDISLDYIDRYDEAGADILVDRIEELIEETGQTGFYFVDEAAPPKALFALARRLIERCVVISWWGNIRFEKTFTAERC